MSNQNLKLKYKNKTVLITGGNGFIGANLTEKLLNMGAKVTIFSKDVYSGWEKAFNIDGKTDIYVGDIASKEDFDRAVIGVDYIFHLAGLSGAPDSNNRPQFDLRINCEEAINLLESCRNLNNTAKIFFPSSQLVYGKVTKCPVLETAETIPTSIYGIHKLTIENYLRLYYELYGLQTSVLRIPNPYGPRQSMDHKYGIVNYFIGLALANKEICIFGEGRQIRDFIYIEDLIQAMLLVAADEKAYGQVYNIGGGEKHSLKQMAEIIIKQAGSGKLVKTDWPEENKRVEIGNIYLSTKKIEAELDWKPKTDLPAGVLATIEFYKNFQNLG